MKLISKPIDVIVGFLNRDKPRPYRFRYIDEEGEEQIVKIEKVICVQQKQIPGVVTYVYECQSSKGGTAYRYELLYKPDNHSWLLYKI